MQTIELRDGRVVLVDDTTAGGADAEDRPTLVWHHESPHTGVLVEPLRTMAADRGLRLLAVTRPGYGGADPLPGRSVADGAQDLDQVLDALGIGRVAVFGGSGGGPHALAAAALLPDRVAALATLASPAPFVDTPAWWDGMADDGGLRAATVGREARLTWAATADFDPAQFVDTDWAALDGDWAALGQDAAAAGGPGLQGAADDDVAFVTDWGFALSAVRVPTFLVHGTRDRVVPVAHGRALAEAMPRATYEERPDDGHIAVLSTVPSVLDRLAAVLRG
ncbi:alpha/beta fold hydrolase [Curtobacterium herbarum]|uniref:AB hydrolase-1 domain-containing protein n=1 Tax=Curtobacterium herbarum TaxID=150122 RepID=A0ABN1ZAT2_9MICO|nr:alpha/beta fold hydrolase [Curtobacterium herbarum]MBM7475462.1 pimeloyl-ACP methyl ester carboxylesterase [Curtobacterium herbarum]MCS6543378.1 alpha/beta hydrolase [Curtobacterium herbarum]